MAKKVLIGTVVIGATRYYAGALLDEGAEAGTVAAVVAAGGQLVDEGDAVIDAAAEVARRRLRDGHWEAVDGIMLAAVAVSARSAASPAPTVFERVPAIDFLRGYKPNQTFDILGFFWAPVDGPVEWSSFVADRFERFVPQIVVGDDVNDVLAGTETGSIAEITLTLTGLDCVGRALSRSITVSAKGAYSLERCYASFALLTSHGQVPETNVHLRTAKGFGALNPIAEGSLQLSLNGANTEADAPFVHGPTGTIIPASEYNAAETVGYIRYRPAAA